MGRRIAIIQGHPDADGQRFCRVLADAYAQAAIGAGHEVRHIDVATLDFPLLTSRAQFEDDVPPEAIVRAQATIVWAEHLVIVFPLWLGAMPARLKGFWEQVLRPGFAHEVGEGSSGWRRLLKGRSARIVVTMGMPAFFYRWFFRAHGLKALERSMLGFSGIGPIRSSLVGMVESPRPAARERWLVRMRQYGRAAR